jgi:hypothetical protein
MLASRDPPGPGNKVQSLVSSAVTEREYRHCQCGTERIWKETGNECPVWVAGVPASNCTSKLQTHPLVREGASDQENSNCQTGNKSGHGLQMGA